MKSFGYRHKYILRHTHTHTHTRTIKHKNIIVTLWLLKSSPPPSPSVGVWSSDFWSPHFCHTALTGASPAEQGRPGRLGAASGLLCEPARQSHGHARSLEEGHEQRDLLPPCSAPLNTVPSSAAAAVWWRHAVSAGTGAATSCCWAVFPFRRVCPPAATHTHIYNIYLSDVSSKSQSV